MDVLARLSEPAQIEDPYPFLSWLRENDPVHRTPDGLYLISRYTDVHRVLVDSSVDFPAPPPDPVDLRTARPHRRLMAGALPSKNPPEHTRLRRHASRGFTVHQVAQLQPEIERITDRLLDAVEEPLRDGEAVDLHSAFSARLALAVLAELLGIPPQDRDSVASLVHDIVLVLSSARADERQMAAADAASVELEAYFRDLIGHRREAPSADLVSAMLETHHDHGPDRLSEAEHLRLLWGFWVAGFETVATVVDQGVLAMAAYPDELHWLREGHAKAARFAEEVLRHQSVLLFVGTVRIPVRDVELSGVIVPRGSMVRPMPAAANRDPRAFPDPDRFDPRRDSAAMLTFGYGKHLCLGSRLARTEITVALAKLHARFPGVVPAGPPVRRQSVGLRVIERLPVAWPAAER